MRAKFKRTCEVIDGELPGRMPHSMRQAVRESGLHAGVFSLVRGGG
jgi:hypothetical protein